MYFANITALGDDAAQLLHELPEEAVWIAVETHKRGTALHRGTATMRRGGWLAHAAPAAPSPKSAAHSHGGAIAGIRRPLQHSTLSTAKWEDGAWQLPYSALAGFTILAWPSLA